METYILPAYWADYLINGTLDNLTVLEKNWIDSFTKDKGACLEADTENIYFAYKNDANNIGGEVCKYTFKLN